MSGNKRITDIELFKIIMDPRRRNIIDLAKEKPVTVSQIAEALGEKPSRLYYHVKKLEEAGILELVETRQHGNLIEKYYKAVPKSLEFDKSILAEHSETVMAQIMNVIEPGLNLFSSQIKKDSTLLEKQVDVAISFANMTGKEWLGSNERMLKAIKEQPSDIKNEKNDDDSQYDLTPEQLEKKSKYAFVILSYRVDDVENE